MEEVQLVSSFRQRPSTLQGWWGFGLAVAFIVMYIIVAAVFMPSTEENPWWMILMPYYGFIMIFCGLAAGVLGLIAIIRKHERSWMVWLSVLPGAMVCCLLLGEFIVPH